MATPFDPTHRVHEAGTPAWREPSPIAPHDPPLDRDLPVDVFEQRGVWAHIRCENGWETWVETPSLEPIGAQAPPEPATGPRRRAPVVVTAIVAFVAVAAAIVIGLSGGGGSKHASSGAPAATGSGHVRLHVPSGWSVSSDGTVAAANPADLAAAVPAGPRVRVMPSGSAGDFKANLAAARAQPPTVKAGPDQTTVDGHKAVAITLAEHDGSVVIDRRYVVAATPGQPSVTFVLEAPDARFAGALGTMSGVPGLT